MCAQCGYTLDFGIHSGKELKDIDRDYLRWIAASFKNGSPKDKVEQFLEEHEKESGE